MNAKQLFFERYRGFREYPELLVGGLSERQLRESPHPALNPIAWLLWHIARCEDVAVNRLLTDGVEVLSRDAWLSRLGVSRREIGTGMTRAEVATLCEEIHLAELAGYRQAVAQQTEQIVAAVPSEELSLPIDTERLRQALVDEGAGGRRAEWLIEAYSGHTRGWLLGHLVLTHHYYHIGQAFAVRSMYGVTNPW
ncbi:MAG: DinB family protein [Acidobacteriota bacterium]